MAIEISKSRSAADGPVQNAPPGSRRLCLAIVGSGVLALSACAGVTPPPRFAAVSPADANGPESVVPPPRPMLTEDGELAGEPAAAPPASEGMPDMPGMDPSAPADPHAGHMEAGATSVPKGGAAYSCPMHPGVSAKGSGSCPICGMTLVKKAARPEAPRR
jgi:Heavy metal binding domain